MTFEEYEEGAVSTAIYPGQGSALGLIYVALKMNGEAGEFAEHVGKALRDDHFLGDRDHPNSQKLTDQRHALLTKEIGDVLWYLAAAAKELGTDLSTIAEANIAKLKDRQARGALGGSGDNR
jgi:NTP pyrophosphatase (non-canonical NTP hydrolase)